MNDKQTTIQQLKEKVTNFRAERGWTHTDQKDVAISITLEAAEILEHFQWHKTETVISNPEWRHAVGEEIADVMFLLLELATELELDLADTFAKKIIKQEKKYPTKDFNPNLNEVEQMNAYYQVKAKTRGGHPLATSESNEKV